MFWCSGFLTSELEAAKMVASRPKATDGMGDKVIAQNKQPMEETRHKTVVSDLPRGRYDAFLILSNC